MPLLKHTLVEKEIFWFPSLFSSYLKTTRRFRCLSFLLTVATLSDSVSKYSPSDFSPFSPKGFIRALRSFIKATTHGGIAKKHFRKFLRTNSSTHTNRCFKHVCIIVNIVLQHNYILFYYVLVLISTKSHEDILTAKVAIFMTTFPQHPLVEFSKQSEFLFHISVHFFIFSAFRKKYMAYYKKHKPYILKYKAFILKYVPCIFALFNFLINSNLYICHKHTSICLCFKALCPRFSIPGRDAPLGL